MDVSKWGPMQLSHAISSSPSCVPHLWVGRSTALKYVVILYIVRFLPIWYTSKNVNPNNTIFIQIIPRHFNKTVLSESLRW